MNKNGCKRVSVLVKGTPESKIIWIIGAIDMDSELSINRFIDKAERESSSCFDKLIKFVDINIEDIQVSDPEDEIVIIDKLVEEETKSVFLEIFQAEGETLGREIEVFGRRIRCCVAKK